MHHRHLMYFMGLIAIDCLFSHSIYAAKPIDLIQQPVSQFQNLFPEQHNAAGITFSELSRFQDFKKTWHVRIQQTYAGYDVWGADAIIHIPKANQLGNSLSEILTAAKTHKGWMNGVVYQNIAEDLKSIPAPSRSQQALKNAISDYTRVNPNARMIEGKSSKLIIYIDEHKKAHWAYQVSFDAPPDRNDGVPARPIYILDAETFAIYEQWNDIQTLQESVSAGGLGGNEKIGQYSYDGLSEHLSSLSILRDADTKQCYLQNETVTVEHCVKLKSNNKCDASEPVILPCELVDSEHNNLYWDGAFDAVNGGYSPSNDALYAGSIVKNLYQSWYGVPVLVQKGEPMMLKMVVHMPLDNAYWNGESMNFGDGVSKFYPLTSVGVAAHEISHGFTQQHSNLKYRSQSGGMNESFSDMAAQAAEYYAYGKNSWQIGPEIVKAPDEALRYMDQPSKDCEGKEPGYCSIDNVSEFVPNMNVHYSSGIYNRIFYTLATTEGWDTRKAFDVMVQANSYYWTSTINFAKGSCGVLQAADDYGYNVEDVKKAFLVVGIDASTCPYME